MKRERHELATIIAVAVNDPKLLDKVAPSPSRAGSPEQGQVASERGAFSDEEWWD